MKRVFLCLAAALSTLWAAAIPAKPLRFTATQADGTTLALTPCGDEFLHYYVTDDRLPVVRGADKSYYHASTDACGRLRPSSVLAHEAALRGAGERRFLSLRGDADGMVASAVRRSVPQKVSRDDVSTPVYSITGKKKGVVILVEFTDVKFTISNPRDFYDRLYNGEGAPEYDMPGSVNKYFLDQSNGLFDVTFDVLGPVTVGHPMAYYGGNDASGNDLRPEWMVREAVQKVGSQADFSAYDWYGDGYVDQVYVVYAGYGEADSNMDNTVWPHAYNLSYVGPTPVIDGVRVDRYACSNELAYVEGIQPDGIGSFCHEYSHCLGLPDAYKTNGGSVYGMDSWSLMDVGCYLGETMNGETPCNYTAFERWCCGWLTPTELSAPCTVAGMAPLSDWGPAYVIYNDANSREYYVLENRQQTGWDRYLPSHGMMVTHIDYDPTAWYNNAVNNTTSHQRYTIFPADNTLEASAHFGDFLDDLYPGVCGNTALTDTSQPAATLNSPNTDGRRYMGKPIEEIAESANGLISFVFCKGTTAIDTPKASAQSDDACYYDLNGRKVSAPSGGVFIHRGRKVLVR